MELSIFIAKIYAVIALISGLGLLLNPTYYQKTFTEMLDNSLALFFAGVFATLTGFLVVTYHNIWEQSWVVIVTLFGWMGLLKGFMLIVFPGSFAAFKPMYKKIGYWQFQSIALIIFGLVFAYFGFMA